MTDNMQFLSSQNYSSDLEGNIGQQAATAANRSTSDTLPRTNSAPGSTTINFGAATSSKGAVTMREMISTLDEPVSVTISRDVKAVCNKFSHVFFPKQSTLLLKDWDLWGPLSLCVTLAISLQGDDDTKTPQFAGLFALIIMGAVAVTVNTKLLSGKLSFFQSVCVLGYCLLPLVLARLASVVVSWFIVKRSLLVFFIRMCVVTGACGWSVFASTAFLAQDTLNLDKRKALAVFPIFLFYFFISWLIILSSA